MLRDVIAFRDFWHRVRGNDIRSRAVAAATAFLEKRVGGEMVYDIEKLPYPYLELASLLEFAELLKERGIITQYGPMRSPPDEPRMAHWYATCNNAGSHVTAGASTESEEEALIKALAEANERYLWYETFDFGSVRVATEKEMEDQASLKTGLFAGYSAELRAQNKRLHIDESSRFAWIQGHSWTKNSPVWLPAQTVSGFSGPIASVHRISSEPFIRPAITNGLASHISRERAVLSGVLELIERDAYIITWLNQLSAPRLDLATLAEESAALNTIVSRCRRYRLEPHIVRLVSDAPTYALCAVLEDMSGIAPRFSFGLKANQNPAKAAEGAILEALRAHRGIRGTWAKKDFNPQIPVREIGHYERLQYWTYGKNHENLEFFIKGPQVPRKKEVFENDSPEEHLTRIVEWCKSKSYSLATVSFTHSKRNFSPWHIEASVIPEIQPAHLVERYPTSFGKRVAEVPRALGLTPRSEPYLDAPHPFA